MQDLQIIRGVVERAEQRDREQFQVTVTPVSWVLASPARPVFIDPRLSLSPSPCFLCFPFCCLLLPIMTKGYLMSSLIEKVSSF